MNGWPDSLTLLGQWEILLDANDVSPKSRDLYTYSLWRLARDMMVRTKGERCHLLEATGTDVAVFLASISKHTTAKTTYARGIRGFYSWARESGYIDRSPMALLHPRKPHVQTGAQSYGLDELTRLLIAAAWRGQHRGLAMLACVGLGTRRSELCGIRPEDIDWDAGTVHLRVTKGDHPRTVAMSPWAEEALRELICIGPAPRGLVPDTVLGIQPQVFTEWVNTAAQDCGFPPGRLRRAHTLRATFATTLSRNGVEPETIRDLLGHSSIATTSVYLVSNAERAAEAVKVLV